MKELMWEYRYVVVTAIATGVVALTQWQVTKEKVFKLMLQAKQGAKDGFLASGKEQEDWVVNMLMKLLPKPFVFFLNEESLRVLVRYLYDKARDYLDDGKFNNSYIK